MEHAACRTQSSEGRSPTLQPSTAFDVLSPLGANLPSPSQDVNGLSLELVLDIERAVRRPSLMAVLREPTVLAEHTDFFSFRVEDVNLKLRVGPRDEVDAAAPSMA